MKNNTFRNVALASLCTLLLYGCGGGGGGSSGPTDLQSIQTEMTSFATLFDTGLPTPVQVTAKLDANFLQNGMDASAYASGITTAPASIVSGDTFELTLATVFDNSSQNNNAADTKWVNAIQYDANGTVISESRVKYVKVGGVWLMAGNERTVQVTIHAESGMTVSPVTYSSDVNIAVDPTTAALAGVASVVVTGTTVLPANGVTVYSNATPATATAAVLTSQIPLCGGSVTTNCTSAVDGSVYTITLKDSGGTVIATYKEALSKAPLATSSLNASMFPSGISSTPASIAGVVPSATLDLSWTNPASLVSTWVDYAVWDSNGALVFQVSGIPAANAFSATMPAFTPPVQGSGITLDRFDITIQGADVYGRQYLVFK